MYLTEQQLKDNFKNFPTHLWIPEQYDGIEFIETKILSLDEIVVDDERAQIRKKSTLGSRKKDLERRWSQEKVDYNQMLPVVSVDDDGGYSLEGGFTRDALFRKVGQTHWVYNVIKVHNEKQLNKYRVNLNKSSHSVPNTKEDMIFNGTKAVQSNEVKIKNIHNWLVEADSSFDDKIQKEIEQQIRKAVKSKSKPKRFLTLDKDTVNHQWIKPKWSKEHRESVGFHFHKTVNGLYGEYMLGHKGGVRDALSQAVDRYMETGVKTLFLVNNSGAHINSSPTLLKSRKNVFKELKRQRSRWDGYYKTTGEWDNVYGVIGYIPNDTTNECQGEPVNPESYKV